MQIIQRNGNYYLDCSKEQRPLESGIYQIKNLHNGKVWVGQAANFYRRWTQHLYKFKTQTNSPRLQNAWNKYGFENFEFSILEFVPRPDLNAREDFYMKSFDSGDASKGYNLATLDRRGCRILSQETKQRMSAAHMGREKPFNRKPRSPEVKERISKALMGRKKLGGHCIGSKNPLIARFGTQNSQYGKKWYMDPITGESKKFKPDQEIPEGWIPGRKIPRLKHISSLEGRDD